MKKLLCAAFAAAGLAAVICAAACSKTEENGGQKKQYTITFSQSGHAPVFRTVYEGESLSAADIPAPKPKKGYAVSWERTDFSAVTGDITVHAIATANAYEITLDLNGGAIEGNGENKKISVTYDSEYDLGAKPVKEDHTFICYEYENKAVGLTGTWGIDGNVTLKAKYEDLADFRYTISFVQEGCEVITRTVQKGEHLSAEDIPEVTPVKGHTVAWESVNFEEIGENYVVRAVITANKYTIRYESGEKGAVLPAAQEVTFGKEFVLGTASHYEKTFVKWIVKGSGEEFVSGVYEIDGDVTLIAVWKSEYSGWVS